MKHPHAELMALYAKDALDTDTPYLYWQVQKKGEGKWYNLTQHPTWSVNDLYRSNKVVYDTYSFVRPMTFKETHKLKEGDTYFIVDLTKSGLVKSFVWKGSISDYARVEQNIAHLSKGNAYNHATILTLLNKKLLDGGI